ncbi:MAG: metallophosphoesterase [Terricaulis sp.]
MSHLWPALIGAALGLPLVIYLAWRLARAWPRLSLRKRWLYGAALALLEAAYWLNVYAWLVEPNMLVVRRVTIESQDWHGAPLTIAALGDTHVGSPHVSVARMERIVARVNALNPDLVVLLGDYVGSHELQSERSPRERAEAEGGIATFASLSAPLGVIGVIGNHDVWYGREAIAQAMTNAGVATLWNRNVVVERDGGDFVVAGLEDDKTGHPDFAAALDGAPDIDTIVISHSPDPFHDMPDGPALMIAGHSHCGQVTIPFFGRPITPLRYGQRYACHRVDENGHIVYVTGGIGTSIAPVRFFNPPEIVLITLRRSSVIPGQRS